MPMKRDRSICAKLSFQVARRGGWLKDLQALPTDGKAVITFPNETGERDRVWMGIAQEIEKFAQAKSK
jgi:hypothetical protein